MEFNEISSREELADFLGIKINVLTYVLYEKHIDLFYTGFDIPKSNGSFRHIHAPTNHLKTIQVQLAKKLSEYHYSNIEGKGIRHNISHAFEMGKSIITNAKIHRNKKFVCCFDIKDFFESINFGRVVGYFEKNHFFMLPHKIATIIAQLVCFHGHLPQGAPTSPIISNLIAEALDYRLLKIAKKYRLDVTRYADDITFSTNQKTFIDKKEVFLLDVAKTVTASGFTLNEDKTHIMYNSSQQRVTGLVVNEKLNVPRVFYNETRAMWHSFYQTGSCKNGEQPMTRNQLEGRFSFIDHLEHYNNQTLLECRKHDARNLSSRERLYRDFLFYIHFINNTMPILVTEGKTDVLYIKAALMSLYQEYPTLVKKEQDGGYRFRFSFFNKTKHWKYFFNMSADGADAITRLYDYFSLKNSSYNLCKYFKDRKAIVSDSPVLFLYDNEQQSERPLHKFIKYAKLNETQKETLNKTNCLLLESTSNLFLVTIPLIQNKAECELEDLFTEETLKTVIDGRSFSRKDENKELYYNKDIFSRYVIQNYESIDFSGFRGLLNTIVGIIHNCQNP